MGPFEDQPTRLLVADEPLELCCVDLPPAEAVATGAMMWALEVLLEDEENLIAAGCEEAIQFGPWLSRPWRGTQIVYDLLAETIPQLVRGVIAMRLADEFRPFGQFNTVGSMALASGMPRALPFAAWAPRAQLMVPLIAGYLTVKGGQPRLAALTHYSHLESAGRDSQAYGVQKLRGPSRSVLRLAGVAGLGGDFVLPRTSQPDMTGMPSDPALPHADREYRTKCEAELRSVGHVLPCTVGDHIEQHLAVNNGAREILERLRETGSRACRTAQIRPAEVLIRGFPSWFAIGPLEYGVSAGPDLVAAGVTMPGGDADLVLRTVRHKMRPLFRLFESADYDDHASLQDLYFYAGGAQYSGRQFVELLMSPDRFERLPGLQEASAEFLSNVGRGRELEEFGVSINPAHVTYLWHHKGIVLTDGAGGRVRLSLVLRSEAGRNTAWTTMADLGKRSVLENVIARCDLHFLSDGDATHASCVPRTFKEFGLHCLQPRSHATRSWMQIACLLANHFLVEVARGRQAC